MRIAEVAGTPTQVAPTRWRARLIEGNRWGSSGYYPREVVERDGPTTWPPGTPVFLDHPGVTEQTDRPERSVRDLAGKISSTPVYESDGLYADVSFYPHIAPLVAEIAGDVGMSIRASAEVKQGEAEGKSGWVVTALMDGESVDVVTKAGAGGRLIEALESARVNESLPGGGSVNDLRRGLEGALGAGRWVLDFDDQSVVYETDEGRKTYRQSYTAEGGYALTGDAVEVRARTVYEPVGPVSTTETDVPADPAGSTEATESKKEDSMATVQVEESQYATLTEQAGRVAAVEAERDKAIEERNKALQAVVEARKSANSATARAIVSAQESYRFNELETRGLVTELPLKESGELDVDAFTQAVVAEATKLAAEAGAGRPSGLGGYGTPGEMSDADFASELAKIAKGA